MAQTSKFSLAYTRTAKAKASHPNESIVRQKEAIYKYACENGYTIIKEIKHIKPSGYLKDFRLLFSMLSKNKKIKTILVYSHDRLTRHVCDCIFLERHLKAKYGVSVIQCKDMPINNDWTNENE